MQPEDSEDESIPATSQSLKMQVQYYAEMVHATYKLPPVEASRPGVSNWWPSSCCKTTSPMRHCKANSYKHDRYDAGSQAP